MGITPEQIAQWMREFSVFVERECEVLAEEFSRQRDPKPDPKVAFSAFVPYLKQQMDAYLTSPGTWRLFYPMTEQSKRDWIRRTFGERIKHHVGLSGSSFAVPES